MTRAGQPRDRQLHSSLVETSEETEHLSVCGRLEVNCTQAVLLQVALSSSIHVMKPLLLIVSSDNVEFAGVLDRDLPDLDSDSMRIAQPSGQRSSSSWLCLPEIRLLHTLNRLGVPQSKRLPYFLALTSVLYSSQYYHCQLLRMSLISSISQTKLPVMHAEKQEGL